MVLLSFPKQNIQPFKHKIISSAFTVIFFISSFWSCTAKMKSQLSCGKKTPSSLALFCLQRHQCMLSHECEFVPASLLDGACPVMLSSSSQGCFPSSEASQHRLNFNRERGGQSTLCSLVTL